MTSVNTSERDVLENYVPRLIERGYTVTFEPRNGNLPDFLSNYQPDAIATSDSGNIVIEVVRKGNADAARRATSLKKALENHPSWRLEVLYSGPSQPLVQSAEESDIIEVIYELPKIGDKRARLLMCWATLEAIARRIAPDETAKPQSPARVVEILASFGRVTAEQAQLLRELALQRNQIVHGNLQQIPSDDSLFKFGKILAQLTFNDEPEY